MVRRRSGRERSGPDEGGLGERGLRPRVQKKQKKRKLFFKMQQAHKKKRIKTKEKREKKKEDKTYTTTMKQTQNMFEVVVKTDHEHVRHRALLSLSPRNTLGFDNSFVSTRVQAPVRASICIVADRWAFDSTTAAFGCAVCCCSRSCNSFMDILRGGHRRSPVSASSIRRVPAPTTATTDPAAVSELGLRHQRHQVHSN